jgi:hypothetical protein
MAGITRQGDPPGQYRGERCRIGRFPRCTHRPTKNVINLAEAHYSMAARRRVQFVFGAIFCKRASSRLSAMR